MGLEDTVQERGARLLERLRQLNEPEIRGFVSYLLTAAAKERASLLEEHRRVAADEQARAVRDEGGRVRAEVEQAWAAKLREASAAATERQAAGLREAQKLADRQLSEKVTGVRAEGQRVLEAALDAARDEADRTLAARLDRQREEAERTLQAARDEAETSAARFDQEREEAAQALQAARHEAETLAARLDRLRQEAEQTLVQALAAAAAEVPPREPPPPIDGVVIRVRDGIRRLDRVSRLTEALDALGSLAAAEASRAAVLTVQDDRVRGWSFSGFVPAVDPAHQVDLTLADAGLVGHAVVTGETQLVGTSAGSRSTAPAPGFAALPADGTAVAVPVTVGGEVMAVLYADDGGRKPEAAWRQSLEILASHAGHCMEALTAARAAQLIGQDVGAMIVEERGPTLPFGETP
ncbi:MAG: GAF domain-containing protein [Acidobacteria bacterium]|nr:GAF domain-containing protein [Acidobacteriota bacterium]